MQIKVNEVKVPIVHSDIDIQKSLSNVLRIKPSSIIKYKILKKSIDSRQKELKYVYSIAVEVSDVEKGLKKSGKFQTYIEEDFSIDAILKGYNKRSLKYRPVVVGTGPAGLFAALTLAKAGLKPLVIERGKEVNERIKSVETFNKEGILDTESNIQFGEGGAGTFSDGKLNTGTSSPLINTVLNEFVRYGAHSEITYEAKPHIGTDILVKIVSNIRNEIISLGGEVLFSTKLVDIKQSAGELTAIVIEKDGNKEVIQTNSCILAIGHSARDTFEMLSHKVIMTQKTFAIGVRVEHLQQEISKAQYKDKYNLLPPAPYKLSCHLDNNRSCYSFCMCPGGYVVAAASEENTIVTNGMSYAARDGINANSALLVNIEPSDFNSDNVLAGVEFQRKYERLAYSISNSYKAPVQRYGDLLKGKISTSFGSVKPTYPIGTVDADLRACLPNFVIDTLLKAMPEFDKKIKGFGTEDALFSGVETRSSSPIRIMRDENYSSSIKGLIPAGEGAGYAGGIMSAAVDGINSALHLLDYTHWLIQLKNHYLSITCVCVIMCKIGLKYYGRRNQRY